MAEEKAENSRQLKGLKWQTQKALDGEGKDSLITQDEDGETIVNLGANRKLFSEGANTEVEISNGAFSIKGTRGEISLAYVDMGGKPLLLRFGEGSGLRFDANSEFQTYCSPLFAQGISLGSDAYSSLRGDIEAEAIITLPPLDDAEIKFLGGWSQLTIGDAKLPSLPSADGTYTLKATVASGAVSYEWVAE